MSEPRLNPAIHVPWDKVLEILQVPTCSKALPLRTRCPLCGAEALNVYHDNTWNRQWHYCAGCHHSGDMIELAAAVWHVSLPAAVLQLARLGAPIPPAVLTPAVLDRYTRAPAVQQRAQVFWDAARESLYSDGSPTWQAIRKQHLPDLSISRERWAAGPGHLVGSAEALAIEKVYRPCTCANWHPTPGATSHVGPYSVLRGVGWSRSVVVPYYSLPGYITSFGILGRRGRLPDDTIHRGLVLPDTNRTNREAGLAGWPSLELSGIPDVAFAVDGWLLSLQIQFRVFRASLRPLPILVWHDDGKLATGKDAWTIAAGRRVIFWPLTIDWRVIRQAVACEGWFCLNGPVEQGRQQLIHYLDRAPGPSLAQRMIRYAVPWPRALAWWMDNTPAPTVDEALLRLEAAGEDVGRLLTECGRAWPGDLRTVPRRRSAPLGTQRVVDDGASWRVVSTKADEEICNAPFTLTHTLRDRGSGRLYFRGVIVFDGRRIPFLAPVETLKTDAENFLQAKVNEHGLGLVRVRPNYGNKLHYIAQLFHTPEYVEDDLWRWAERLAKEDIYGDPLTDRGPDVQPDQAAGAAFLPPTAHTTLPGPDTQPGDQHALRSDPADCDEAESPTPEG